MTSSCGSRSVITRERPEHVLTRPALEALSLRYGETTHYAVLDDEAVRAWADGRTLERATASTICQVDDLCAELATVRRRGYAVDDQENEVGVNCVALPVWLTSPGGTSQPTGAIGVSALTYRTPLALLESEVAQIRQLIDSRLADSA